MGDRTFGAASRGKGRSADIKEGAPSFAQSVSRKGWDGATLTLSPSCFCSSAALRPVPCALSQTANRIAARVDHHYNALHSLRVNFVQEYNGLGQNLRESGILLLKKPGRMKWTYSQPARQALRPRRPQRLLLRAGQTEVQRVPAKKLDDLRSPLRFLLGHSELAKELTGLTLTPQGATTISPASPKTCSSASLPFASPSQAMARFLASESKKWMAPSQPSPSPEKLQILPPATRLHLPRPGRNRNRGRTSARVKFAEVRVSARSPADGRARILRKSPKAIRWKLRPLGRRKHAQ